MPKPLLPLFDSACADLIGAVDRVVCILMDTDIPRFPESPVWFYGVEDTSYFLQVRKIGNDMDAYIKVQRNTAHEWKRFKEMEPAIQVAAAAKLLQVLEAAEAMILKLLHDMRAVTLTLESTADKFQAIPAPGDSPVECP